MSIATVVSLSGQAWARDAGGNLRELRLGDQLQEGETLVTSDDAAVELDFMDGLPPVAIGGDQQVAMSGELDPDSDVDPEESSADDEGIEALLTALDGNDDLLDVLDATAAGGGDGAEGGGHSFIQLARVLETVDPLSFAFDAAQGREVTNEPLLSGGAVDPQTVNGVNDAPSGVNDGPDAVGDAFTTDEDTALDGANVLANDSDPEGDALTVSDAGSRQVTFTGPDGFTVTTNVTIAADGSLSFDPSGDFDALGVGEAATGTLEYTVSDGDTSDTASVTLTVNGVNDAPSGVNDGPDAVGDAFTTDEDTALDGANVLANDSDPEGDALTVSDAGSRQVTFTGPDGFTVTTNVTIAADGSLSFDPSGDFDALGVGEAATGTLIYTVSDGTATDSASVTLTVNGLNEVPEEPEAEDPVPLIASAHGYVSGQGNGNNTGTYADSNGLKDTSATNADAIVSDDGFYSVERIGNSHGESSDYIDPTEALVLQLGQAVTSVTLEVQGEVGGAQWSVYAANGDRLGGTSSLGEPDSEGFLTVSYATPFSYIALDGGDDSAFAVKPVGVGIAGTASDDTLNASAGDDTLVGGEGDDILYGQDGADVFAWRLGDEGQLGDPAQDIVKDFSIAEEDSLDLAELLVDEQAGAIDDFLHAEPSASGDDTILHVSTQGGFDGDYDSNAGKENQTITLEGVSMEGQSSQDFINSLIENGSLNIDQ